MGERISAELAHSLLQSSHWHLSNNETCFDLLIYYTLRSCHWLTKSIEIILERWVRTSFPVSNLILDVTRMDRHSVNGEAVSQTEKVGTHSNLAFTAEAPDIYWYLLIVHSFSFLAQQSFWSFWHLRKRLFRVQHIMTSSSNRPSNRHQWKPLYT